MASSALRFCSATHNRIFPRFSIFGYYIQAPIPALHGRSSSLFDRIHAFFASASWGEYLAMILKEIKRRPAAIIQQRIERPAATGNRIPHPRVYRMHADAAKRYGSI